MQSLFESSPGPLLKSGLGPWSVVVSTRKQYVGDLNRSTLHLAQDWNGLERVHYLSRTQIRAGGVEWGSQVCGPWSGMAPARKP